MVLGRRSFGGFNAVAEAAYDSCIRDIAAGTRLGRSSWEGDDDGDDWGEAVSDNEMAERCDPRDVVFVFGSTASPGRKGPAAGSLIVSMLETMHRDACPCAKVILRRSLLLRSVVTTSTGQSIHDSFLSCRVIVLYYTKYILSLSSSSSTGRLGKKMRGGRR